MTYARIMRRHNGKRALWFLIRWGAVLSFVYVCFRMVYPTQLINNSPDLFALLRRPNFGGRLAGPAFPFIDRTLRALMAWLPERTVLPAVYPVFAPYINPGIEYTWLLFLAVCIAASIAGSFSVMALWRAMARYGVYAARRAKRAIRLFVFASALVIALNFCLGALVYLLWSNGRPLATIPLWDWLTHLGIFIIAPAGALLSAWKAAPARISGKRSFFR